MLGILLINKPAGLSSHDVVARMRRRFETKRVGHAGTLDPLGRGLMVVAVGSATRFLQYLPLEPKVYVAEVTFGKTSTTYDAEGELHESGVVPTNLDRSIAEVADRFSGMITQVPPIYSAIKVQGKPLYKYAREGKEVEVRSRQVHIGRFEVKATHANKARIEIECSGGTYIRSIAHDLGQFLGCGAYLSDLLRTQCGKFSLQQAVSMEEAGSDSLIPLSVALPPMPLHRLCSSEEISIRQGQRVRLSQAMNADLIGLQDVEGNVIGIGRVHGNQIQPECVLPLEAMG